MSAQNSVQTNSNLFVQYSIEIIDFSGNLRGKRKKKCKVISSARCEKEIKRTITERAHGQSCRGRSTVWNELIVGVTNRIPSII